MTADEIALKAKLYNLFVNLGFGAATSVMIQSSFMISLSCVRYSIFLFTGAHRKITSQSLKELSSKSLLLSIRPSPKASSMVC